MASLTIEFVCQATGAALSGPPPAEPLAGVSTDSRTIAPGQLFVALAGPNFDGHAFVPQALAEGAAAALVRAGYAAPPEMTGACLLRVPDTLRALGDLAGAWRREQSAIVAGLTGSNGKTSTKEMLAAILQQRHRVLKTQGNLNNLIGLPLTLLGLGPEHTACVVEMGMSALGEIARLTEIAAPELGLITNVGPAHLGPLGSLANIAQAKTELFRGLDPAATALVNLDDPWLAPWADKLACRVVTFGGHERAMVRCGDVSALGGRLAFSLWLPTEDPIRVRLAAPGRHNVMNACAAAAAALVMGQDGATIREGLESFAPVKGRLEQKRGFFGFWVLDDTYNANPASLAAGLAALKDVAGGRPMGLILGDMLELGPTSPQLHRLCGRQAAEAGCRLVLALGQQAQEVAAGAREGGLRPEAALAFADRLELIEAAQELFEEDEVVLVKGSRSMGMERVVKALTTGEVA
ncbi:MAG: UDP-N-acetylmuramoyl-tripeptide--D-alanyl-D-alanine ligase [Desulfarculus sp.]|nr:UDP-N-acetylmuramoyl-tripeptide--D-alanyl-D-alanine ligase [Desulfarculus sp.]